MEKKPDVYRKQNIRSDKIFKLAATIAGSFVLVIIALMIFQLISESYPIWEAEGLGFIIGTDWNAVEGRESFGALPYIAGTLVTAALAMAIAEAVLPMAVGPIKNNKGKRISVTRYRPRMNSLSNDVIPSSVQVGRP